MFSTSKRGARRVSSPVYKLLLATHITVSVGWLGVVAAKLILEVGAATFLSVYKSWGRTRLGKLRVKQAK